MCRRRRRIFGQQVHVLNASNERDLDAAFASLALLRADALLVSSDAFLNSRRDQIVARVAQQAVPAIYEWREFAEAGGLMSYGSSLVEHTAKSASTLAEFSRARNRSICLCCSQPNLNWSSISRPRKRLVSPCRPGCCPSPTM